MMLTPTESRLLDLLKDGEEHTMAEILACITPDLRDGDPQEWVRLAQGTARFHFFNLRKKLTNRGFTVACVQSRSKFRLVKFPTKQELNEFYSSLPVRCN